MLDLEYNKSKECKENKDDIGGRFYGTCKSNI